MVLHKHHHPLLVLIRPNDHYQSHQAPRMGMIVAMEVVSVMKVVVASCWNPFFFSSTGTSCLFLWWLSISTCIARFTLSLSWSYTLDWLGISLQLIGLTCCKFTLMRLVCHRRPLAWLFLLYYVHNNKEVACTWNLVFQGLSFLFWGLGCWL